MGVHQDKEVYLKIKELLGIPPDEPIVIFRAQDKWSIQALVRYRDHAHSIMGEMTEEAEKWLTQFRSIISDFLNWQRDNRDKVKVPD